MKEEKVPTEASVKDDAMTKEEVQQKAQEELKSFRDQIQEMREKTASLGDEAKKRFETHAKELEELYAEAEKNYGKFSKKAGEEWQELKGFVELTNKALRHSFNYFISHYRTKK